MKDMYQYIQTEIYSMKAKKDKYSVEDVISEAQRLEGCYSPQIENPGYYLVYGNHPTDVLKNLKNLTSLARARVKGGKFRKLRKDAQVLVEPVCSYPVSVVEMGTNWKDNDDLNRWVNLSVEHFEKRYGAQNVRSVVLHMDESHPHIHVFMHEDLDEDSCLSINNIHPGKMRESKAKRNKKEEFNKGFQDIQDTYYEDVSLKMKWLKSSDSTRKHLSRKEYLKQKEIKEKSIEKAVELSRKAFKETEKTISELTEENKLLKQLCEDKDSIISEQSKEIHVLERTVSFFRIIVNKLRSKLSLKKMPTNYLPTKEIVDKMLKVGKEYNS